MDGASSAQAPGRKTKIIPFAPAVADTQDLLTEAPGIAGHWPNLLFLPPFTTKGSWAVGQSVALIRSDVALLIGGGPLTANVRSLALELGKPYYAVARLGDAAKALADDDYAKHRAMGMPEEWITPSQPGHCGFRRKRRQGMRIRHAGREGKEGTSQQHHPADSVVSDPWRLSRFPVPA